jgi:Domain of unknown function (DUF4258)
MIKARPFTTKIGDVDVEGFFDETGFVFRFYGLVVFRPTVVSSGEDEFGKYAVLEETEISHPDGFVFRIEIGVDEMLECEWGYLVTLRRDDLGDRALVEAMLRQRGIDPDSAILVIPPRQLTSVYFNPRGEIDGTAQLGGDVTADSVPGNEALLQDKVRASASQRILFLPHAIRQMSRPDRMITTREVRTVIENGVVIEAYVDDCRGASCLLLGYGSGDRAIHVVCSPKADFLAIITAYLPNRDEWSDDFKVRIKR